MNYVLLTFVMATVWLAGCNSTVNILELQTVDLGDGHYSAYYINKETTLPSNSDEYDEAKPAFSWALWSDNFQLFPVNTLERYSGKDELTLVRLIQNQATGSQQIKRPDGGYLLPDPVFQISSAQLSPSKKYIVFSCRVSPGAPWTVWLMGFGGESPRLLAFGKDPVWKNDNTVVYSSKIANRWGLVQSSIDGSSRRTLVSKTMDCLQPHLSPDGSKIAYVTRYSTTMASQIWVCSSEGDNPHELTSYPGLNDSPVWGKDGNFVYFRSTRGGGWGAWKIAVD